MAAKPIDQLEQEYLNQPDSNPKASKPRGKSKSKANKAGKGTVGAIVTGVANNTMITLESSLQALVEHQETIAEQYLDAVDRIRSKEYLEQLIEQKLIERYEDEADIDTTPVTIDIDASVNPFTAKLDKRFQAAIDRDLLMAGLVPGGCKALKPSV